MHHNVRHNPMLAVDAIPSELSFDHHKERFSKFLTVSLILSILFGPATLTAFVVWITKPNGFIGPFDHTAFWLLSSLAIGFALVFGAMMLVSLLRVLLRLYIDSLMHFVRINQAQLLQEIKDGLGWMDEDLHIVTDEP